MKYFIPGILCMLIGVPVSLNAQISPQLLFDRANIALEQGNWTEAMQLYREIEQSGSISGALYLNMGIISVDKDSLGLAKYYFLKASGFAQTEESATEGLEFVESKFSRVSASLPLLPWEAAVKWLVEVPGTGTAFIVSIMLIWASVSLILFFWFRKPDNRKIMRHGIQAGILGLAFLAGTIYLDYIDRRYSEAVMVYKQAEVRESPAEDAPLVSLSFEGYTFTVDRSKSTIQPEWSYVRMANGQFGWIHNRFIKKL